MYALKSVMDNFFFFALLTDKNNEFESLTYRLSFSSFQQNCSNYTYKRVRAFLLTNTNYHSP